MEGKFGLFAQLSKLFNLPKCHFFRYLQLRHFVQKSITSFPDLPMDNMIDHILSLSSGSKGLISTLYNNICVIIPHSLQDVRKLWENDLGEEMTDDQWETVLKLIHSSFTCARHRLIQLKVVLRAHLTKARLAKIFPDVNPLCPRCKGQPADYLHMLWSCPKLSTFWVSIFSAYSKMFQKYITPNPIWPLFGFTPHTYSLKGKACVVIAFMSLIARHSSFLEGGNTSQLSKMD